MSLMLHCGAYQVDRKEVYGVETPEATETHFPVPHTLLLEEVEKNLEGNGYEIVNQSHALTKAGQRYFGLLEVRKPQVVEVEGERLTSGDPGDGLHLTRREFVHLDDPSVKPDYGLVIGLRNTHDCSYCAALTMGNRVFVCDNLSFSGEVLIGRRHTKNIRRDLPLMIPRAFGALSVERVNMETRISAYKDAEITDEQAHDMILRSLVDENIFPASKIKSVVNEWRRPSHEEFEPRTVWSLFNAYTEAAKPVVTTKIVKDEETGEEREVEVIRGGNIATLTDRTRKLHGYLDKRLGIAFKTRDEVLAEGDDEDVEVGRAAARFNRN